MNEYKIIKDTDFLSMRVLKKINDRALEGWEVVSSTAVIRNGNTEFTLYLLKRELQTKK